MPRIDNNTFYLTSLERHGKTSQGVHWNSSASQAKRFEVLCRFLPDPCDEITIVDAGCGFGDLYLYLKKRRRMPKKYVGLELMEPMAEEARERTGCEVYLCDVLKEPLIEADYYLCSGAMNILTRFETHLFIRRCFEASRKGFIFNLLEGEDESMVYNYFLPKEIRTLGEELGATVKIARGYLPKDFTAAFFKTESGKKERGGQA